MEEKKYLIIDGKQTRIEDLTGRKFGRLTVIRFDNERYKNDIIRKNNNEIKQVQKYWLCNCDCGTMSVSVNLGNLKSGHTSSCGCLAVENKLNFAENLSNQRFGRLVVIERDYEKEKHIRKKKSNHNVFWKCQCDCGNYKTIQAGQLKSGETNSCGCLNSEIASKNRTIRAIKENGSLGDWIINNLQDNFLELYWSNKNKKSPFKIAPKSASIIIHIICDKCGEEYFLTPNEFVLQEKRCPICKVSTVSKGENKIKNFLDMNNVKYEQHVKFDNLLGIKNGQLSYDFYLEYYNLLIEYQGNFHDGTADIQTKEDFEIQKEHDKRKREYAKNNNIKLLEVWYWEFGNIEDILNKTLNIN